MKSISASVIASVLVVAALASLSGPAEACNNPQAVRLHLQRLLTMYPQYYREIMGGQLTPNNLPINNQGFNQNPNQGFNQNPNQGFNQNPNQGGFVNPNQPGGFVNPNQPGGFVNPNQPGGVPVGR